MSSSTSTSTAPKSPSRITLSGATLSGGVQTFESFGSRTNSIKTLSIASKPPSPMLMGEASALFNAPTGSSASTSAASASNYNIASDLQRLAVSGN